MLTTVECSAKPTEAIHDISCCVHSAACMICNTKNPLSASLVGTMTKLISVYSDPDMSVYDAMSWKEFHRSTLVTFLFHADVFLHHRNSCLWHCQFAIKDCGGEMLECNIILMLSFQAFPNCPEQHKWLYCLSDFWSWICCRSIQMQWQQHVHAEHACWARHWNGSCCGQS